MLVTPIISTIVNSGVNNGLMVRLQNETSNYYHQINFATRENTVPTLRPQLCITYNVKNVTVCYASLVVLTAPVIAGATYKWFRLSDNALIATVRTKNILAVASGCYRVVVTNSSGCTAADTVCINMSLTASAGNDTTICKGSCAPLRASVIQSGNSSAVSYQWSSSETTQTISKCPLVTTTYTVTATDVNGCTSKATVTVTVKNIPAQPGTINGGPINCVCNGTYTYCITPVAGASSCIWTVSPGSTIVGGQGTNCVTVSFAPSFVTGAISVTCGNECGMSAPRTLTVYSRPAAPVISGPSIACRFSNATYSCQQTCGVNYIWAPSVANNGSHTSIIGVTFNNLTATTAQVCVSAVNACGISSIQTCKTIAIPCRMADDGTTGSEMLQVFPNPAHDELNVTFNLVLDVNYVLQLSDVMGRTVLTDKGKGTGDELHLVLDVSKLAKGSYIIQLKSGQGTSQKNIVLQ